MYFRQIFLHNLLHQLFISHKKQNKSTSLIIIMSQFQFVYKIIYRERDGCKKTSVRSCWFYSTVQITKLPFILVNGFTTIKKTAQFSNTMPQPREKNEQFISQYTLNTTAGYTTNCYTIQMQANKDQYRLEHITCNC